MMPSRKLLVGVFLCLLVGRIRSTGAVTPPLRVLPDIDRTRKERLIVNGRRMLAPEGFVVEEVAGNDLVGSVVTLAFDAEGRPVLGLEDRGVVILTDPGPDGRYRNLIRFSKPLGTSYRTQGLLLPRPGEVWLHWKNAQKESGLFRMLDDDGDDRADRLEMLAGNRGGLGEHGPHAIVRGPEGLPYVLYGNHSAPMVEASPQSPVRDLREDFLLPRYTDPKGHATNVRAPAGTVYRLDPERGDWFLLCGGFRNPYDFAFNLEGEMFTYDADMEWDYGLPWYRPTRVVHVIPGGDYGWRTGSAKIPFYCIDTLPSLFDIGRGSPVGIVFYHHHVYPDAFRGALFLGDWSRGRIRVLVPRKNGGSYQGECKDFILGEPLNVTDLAVGPDGCLYFTTGGRGTTGGLYRVVWTGPRSRESQQFETMSDLEKILHQPMPRTAWGRRRLSELKDRLGDSVWEKELRRVAEDGNAPALSRIRAMELLGADGPGLEISTLGAILGDPDPSVRAAAVLWLGVRHPLSESVSLLEQALDDEDAFVVRRACEALVRAGVDSSSPDRNRQTSLAAKLFRLLDHPDRFVRYAARVSISRLEGSVWKPLVYRDDPALRPRGAAEGLLACIYTQSTTPEADEIARRVDRYSQVESDAETTLRLLRVFELAFIRDLAPSSPGREELKRNLGKRLLERFPAKDRRVDRELQVLLAYTNPEGAIPALLDRLTPDQPQEEQIHTVYCLRTIRDGWTPEQRKRLVDWFKRAWEFRGAASMEGYINNLWNDTLALLNESEKKEAESMRQRVLQEREAKAQALLDRIGDAPVPGKSDLAQMSFEELSGYLEYDIMTYERGDPKRGELVFRRSKCVDCHRFGSIGKGTGPDLSTVVRRFRRREILESIMYPSKVVSDQYQSVNVTLNDGEVVSGFVAEENEKTLALININGERIEIDQGDIEDRRPSSVSMMPEGLIYTMTLQDLVDLFRFLESGSEN